MKKFIIYLVGAMMVLSLAACTPTPEKEAKARTQAADEKPVAASTGGAEDKVPDPNAEKLVVISIFYSNEDASGLSKDMDAVKELTAQSLVDKLIERGILEDGTEVISYEEADGTGTLDLSKAPGGKNESAALTALGNTFIDNFETLLKLKLLVNGENYSGSSIQHSDNDYLIYVKDYKKLGQ